MIYFYIPHPHILQMIASYHLPPPAHRHIDMVSHTHCGMIPRAALRSGRAIQFKVGRVSFQHFLLFSSCSWIHTPVLTMPSPTLHALLSSNFFPVESSEVSLPIHHLSVANTGPHRELSVCYFYCGLAWAYHPVVWLL